MTPPDSTDTRTQKATGRVSAVRLAAVVLVGAMIVASVETVWAGLVAPPSRQLRSTEYGQAAPSLAKGEEMGRFKLGSTAIVLFGPEAAHWHADLKAGSAVSMGQLMGTAQQ